MTNSKRASILLVTFILFLCGCSTNNAVYKRYFLYENSIKVVEKPTGNVSNSSYNNSISRPEIVGLKNTKIQNSINKELNDYISSVVSNFESALSKTGKANKSSPVTFNSSGRVDNSLILGFSTHANYNNALCLSIDYYMSLNRKWESGIKVFRFDLNTGRHLELKDLFPDGMDYKTEMTQAINMQILSGGFEDYFLNAPLNDIETYEDFYFNENSITIVFNTKDNPFFTDTRSLKFTDYPMNTYNNYITDNLISFPVSFNKLDNMVTIFDKYLSNKNIYKTNKLKKKPISDYIDKSSPVREKIVGNTSFRAYFFQIYDMENKSLKDKINRIVLKEVDDFFNEERLICHLKCVVEVLNYRLWFRCKIS